jgi:signal transduction histidine kinase
MRPSVSEVVGATACAVLTLSGAIVLPLLAAAEPHESIPSVSPADAAWWVTVAFVLAQSTALLWARRSSRFVLSAVALIPLVHAIAIPGGTFSLTTVAVSFAVFWAVIRRPFRGLRGLLSLVALLVAVAQLLNDARSGTTVDVMTIAGAVLQAITVVGMPSAIGSFFAARHEAQVSRGNELLALRRERDALIQTAVARERITMSRELHDIAAHHVSGIALLASALYRQIDIDPETAKLSAQQVRAQSTRVLDDLRRVIGLLRDETGSNRSVETLAAIGELVEFRRAAGIDVRFTLLTADHELGAGIGPLGQLVAYRMVQEALANAAVHAPGADCVVEIDDRAIERLTVLVENDGAHAPDPGPGTGFGLIGMRERAELVDGDLHYGAVAGGGWQVRLTLRKDAMIDDANEDLA